MSNYTSFGSDSSSNWWYCLKFPSGLDRFINRASSSSADDSYTFFGELDPDRSECVCESCGSLMHIHDRYSVKLSHLPFDRPSSNVVCLKHRFKCPKCNHYKMETIPFQAGRRKITKPLLNYVERLLSLGLNNKQVSLLSGLNQMTIKSIDKEMLVNKYTSDGKSFKKPDVFSKFIMIDEFKLHNNYRYATVISDMSTGHILWLQKGKKKKVVYDFIEHVGTDWMSHVVAVACDMNSDFQEAFKEKCPHLKIVFDHFHIIKNFNEKVVSAVRKDVQAQLLREGRTEEAKSLKGSRFILTSNRSSLEKKDLDNHNDPDKKDTKYVQLYDELLKKNELFFMADLVKEMMNKAYHSNSVEDMSFYIRTTIDCCNNTNNKRFMWFAKLLDKHFDGIVNHAVYKISSGKMEGINNKIKTLRRNAYGFRDTFYFFLKIFGAFNGEDKS